MHQLAPDFGLEFIETAPQIIPQQAVHGIHAFVLHVRDEKVSPQQPGHVVRDGLPVPHYGRLFQGKAVEQREGRQKFAASPGHPVPHGIFDEEVHVVRLHQRTRSSVVVGLEAYGGDPALGNIFYVLYLSLGNIDFCPSAVLGDAVPVEQEILRADSVDVGVVDAHGACRKGLGDEDDVDMGIRVHGEGIHQPGRYGVPEELVIVDDEKCFFAAAKFVHRRGDVGERFHRRGVQLLQLPRYFRVHLPEHAADAFPCLRRRFTEAGMPDGTGVSGQVPQKFPQCGRLAVTGVRFDGSDRIVRDRREGFSQVFGKIVRAWGVFFRKDFGGHRSFSFTGCDDLWYRLRGRSLKPGDRIPIFLFAASGK